MPPAEGEAATPAVEARAEVPEVAVEGEGKAAEAALPTEPTPAPTAEEASTIKAEELGKEGEVEPRRTNDPIRCPVAQLEQDARSITFCNVDQPHGTGSAAPTGSSSTLLDATIGAAPGPIHPAAPLLAAPIGPLLPVAPLLGEARMGVIGILLECPPVLAPVSDDQVKRASVELPHVFIAQLTRSSVGTEAAQVVLDRKSGNALAQVDHDVARAVPRACDDARS